MAEHFSDITVLKPRRKYKIGLFSVMPIPAFHNVECYSFIIEHESFGRLAFITDSFQWPYNVKDINTLMIEANFDEQLRANAILSGFEPKSRSVYHMSLNKCISVINRLKSPSLQPVLLLHLSPRLSDSEAFKQAIREQCGIRAEVASENTEFILRKDDF